MALSRRRTVELLAAAQLAPAQLAAAQQQGARDAALYASLARLGELVPQVIGAGATAIERGEAARAARTAESLAGVTGEPQVRPEEAGLAALQAVSEVTGKPVGAIPEALRPKPMTTEEKLAPRLFERTPEQLAREQIEARPEFAAPEKKGNIIEQFYRDPFGYVSESRQRAKEAAIAAGTKQIAGTRKEAEEKRIATELAKENIQQHRESAAAQLKLAEATLGQKAQEAQRERTFTAEQKDLDRQLKREELAMRRSRLAGAVGVLKGKEKQGAIELQSSLDQLDRIIADAEALAKRTGIAGFLDVPINTLAQAIGVDDPALTKLRSDIAAWKAVWRHAFFGGSLTKTEKDAAADAVGEQAWQNDHAFLGTLMAARDRAYDAAALYNERVPGANIRLGPPSTGPAPTPPPPPPPPRKGSDAEKAKGFR